MNGWMDREMDEWIEKWMDGQRNGWMDRVMDGWIDSHMIDHAANYCSG